MKIQKKNKLSLKRTFLVRLARARLDDLENFTSLSC